MNILLASLRYSCAEKQSICYDWNLIFCVNSIQLVTVFDSSLLNKLYLLKNKIIFYDLKSLIFLDNIFLIFKMKYDNTLKRFNKR